MRKVCVCVLYNFLFTTLIFLNYIFIKFFSNFIEKNETHQRNFSSFVNLKAGVPTTSGNIRRRPGKVGNPGEPNTVRLSAANPTLPVPKNIKNSIKFGSCLKTGQHFIFVILYLLLLIKYIFLIPYQRYCSIFICINNKNLI